jgi:hypothetical protein
MAKHYSEQEDIVILEEIIESRPFSVAHGKSQAAWQTVSDAVSVTIGRIVNAKSVRERFDVMIKKFKQDERASLRSSGTSEVITKKDALLEECVGLMGVSEVSKSKSTKAKFDFRELSLIELGDQEPTSINGSESLITEDQPIEELGPVPIRRNKKTKLATSMNGQVTASQNVHQEILENIKKSSEQKKEALEFEKEKFKEEKAKRESQEKQQRRREKAQGKKDTMLLKLLTSLVKKFSDDKENSAAGKD